MSRRQAPPALRRAALAAWVLPFAIGGCGPVPGALTTVDRTAPAAGDVGLRPAGSRDAVPVPPAELGLYVAAWDRRTGGPPTADQVALGRRLFHDTAMSRDGSTSCGTCHRPELAFTDGRRIPEGVAGATGRRNSPTLVNRAYGRTQFWDGRVESLEEQVLRPIADPAELGSSVAAEVERLRSDASYATAFTRAFGQGPDTATLAAALAAFVGTIFSATSPLDRYLAGDTAALSVEQRRGRRLFIGRARCSLCHMGPNLTDEAFHNTGVAWADGVPADSGRAEVTGLATDLGAFKTPTLREIALTAPYMHDGSIATLELVIDFYDRGGHQNPHLDHRIAPIGLTGEEKAALASFLRALAGTPSR